MFEPIADVAVLLHALLDGYERRGGEPRRPVRVALDEVALPGYYSQADPLPRAVANEQLRELEAAGLLRLDWPPGQAGHLLRSVTLAAGRTTTLYDLLGREPLAGRRERLRALLLGERFRLSGWRLRAVQRALEQLAAQRSPAPFRLGDDAWNQDLLAALAALPDGESPEEVPYRLFSVRLYNDSKRFETLKGAVAGLARRHEPGWRTLDPTEALRELGLVANPGHLYLYGPWQLIDADGQVLSLEGFAPSVGVPAALAGRVQAARVEAARVVCVENLASFYELVRHQAEGLAALCLWGNPAPAARHLLRCLALDLPAGVPLLLWADVDCGGLRILAHLREQVSGRFAPYRMDCATLEAHARWARPLSRGDEGHLHRLKHHPALADVVSLIDLMVRRGIKLEQEAVVPA
jgi:hypothetical protein